MRESHDEPGGAIDLNALISRLVSGQMRPTVATLRVLRDHVIDRALLVAHDIPAPPEVSGAQVGRRALRTGDAIDVRLAKHLQHVVREEQWPAGTTFDEYVGSLVDVVRSNESGIFADRRGTRWVVTFIARSGIWQGLDGGPFIVVIYDCSEERLLTAFQPDRGLAYVDDNLRVVDGVWLRRPR